MKYTQIFFNRGKKLSEVFDLMTSQMRDFLFEYIIKIYYIYTSREAFKDIIKEYMSQGVLCVCICVFYEQKTLSPH